MSKRNISLFVTVVFAATLGVLSAFGLRYSILQAQNEPLPLPTSNSALQNAPTNEEQMGFTSETSGSLPDWAQAKLDAARARYAPFKNHTLYNYNVGYLVDENLVSSNSFVYPSKLSEQGNINVISSQEELKQLSVNQNLHAIVIHESTLNMLDQVSFRDAYRNGVVIVGINIPFKELSRLIDNRCEYADTDTSYQKDYFIAFSYFLSPNNEADRETINRGILEECQEPNLGYRYHYYVSHRELNDKEHFEYFKANVLEHLIDIQVRATTSVE